MPLRDGPVRRMEMMSMAERLAEPDRCQEHWYDLAARYCGGLSVLDVGAGTGYGLVILAAGGASRVDGIDPLPAGPGVSAVDVSQVSNRSFDVVTAMDVIEHVEDDATFLSHLLRVARQAVFFSTPNWNRFHATNPCHFREYMPEELEALLKGVRCESWSSDDWPKQHLPWRTVRPVAEAANFGVWLWKSEPLRHCDCPQTDYWDTLPDPQFLNYDRTNPARAAAADIIAKSNARRIVEIGPGAGYDYLDHFRCMPVSYVAYEGSTKLRAEFLASAPEADVRAGGFLDLAPDSFDLCYTKATLEHQRDFRDGLRRMVQAAPHVVVNWYLPPDAEGKPCYAEDQGIWYNRYRRAEIVDFLHALGCLIEEHLQPPPGNSVWIISRRIA